MVVDDAYSDVQIVESIRRSAGHEAIAYLDTTRRLLGVLLGGEPFGFNVAIRARW
jgi:hypothetical protein